MVQTSNCNGLINGLIISKLSKDMKCMVVLLWGITMCCFAQQPAVTNPMNGVPDGRPSSVPSFVGANNPQVCQDQATGAMNVRCLTQMNAQLYRQYQAMQSVVEQTKRDQVLSTTSVTKPSATSSAPVSQAVEPVVRK
jgi:hypothetical protein